MTEALLILSAAIGVPTLAALLLSGQFRSPRACLLCLAAIGAVCVNMIAMSIGASMGSLLPGLEYNWPGKIIGIALTLGMYFLLPRPLRAETGIFAIPRASEWKSTIAVSAALLLTFWVIAYVFRDGKPLTGETILFQATMPGLDEEAMYRGVLLALLVGALGKPLSVAGIRIGWGALPIVAFFGLAHGLTEGLSAETLVSMFAAAFMGAGLLWLKERTASIWVAVVVHNLANIGSVTLNALPKAA